MLPPSAKPLWATAAGASPRPTVAFLNRLKNNLSAQYLSSRPKGCWTAAGVRNALPAGASPLKENLSYQRTIPSTPYGVTMTAGVRNASVVGPADRMVSSYWLRVRAPQNRKRCVRTDTPDDRFGGFPRLFFGRKKNIGSFFVENPLQISGFGGIIGKLNGRM